MNNKSFSIALVLAFAFYALITVISPFQGRIIFPIMSLVLSVVVMVNITKMKSYQINWVMIWGMMIMWVLVSFLYEIIHVPRNILILESDLIKIVIFVSNCLMMLSIGGFFYIHLNHLNRIQLLADMFITVIIIFGCGAGVYYTRIDFSRPLIFSTIIIIGIITVSLLSLVALLSMILSNRHKTHNQVLLPVAVSFIVFAIANFIYAYRFFRGIFDLSTLVNMLLLVSFTGFASTSHIKTRYYNGENPFGKLEEPRNMGSSRIVFTMMIMAVFLFFIGLITFPYLITMGGAFFIYMLFNYLSQQSIKKEVLLDKEILINLRLEKIIEERTKELTKINKQLELEAVTDSLTGLKNRKFLTEKMEYLIHNQNHAFSVFYIDLKHFKVINDIHGHRIGDLILIELAKRFLDIQEECCVFTRFSGDEFVVIYDEVSLAAIDDAVNKIYERIFKKINIDELEFNLDASIGIARYPQDAKTVNELIRKADIAMHHTKGREKTRNYMVHSEKLGLEDERKNRIELLLKKANYDKEFQLYYQPQFNIESKKLVGMEALLRWNAPGLGAVSPGEFIPIAEDMGLIIKISDWVFYEGLKQIKRWNKKYHTDLVLYLNVSPISLDTVSFIPNIVGLMSQMRISPNWIGIEITEHSAMATAVQMEEFLSTLSNIGVSIAIDDFGTGYSSLSYIKRFDVNIIKIAKELIDNIEYSQSDKLIVKAIIMMSEGMGLETLAEGVETDEQLQILKELNCDKVQGYIYGKPVPSDIFEDLFMVFGKN